HAHGRRSEPRSPARRAARPDGRREVPAVRVPEDAPGPAGRGARPHRQALRRRRRGGAPRPPARVARVATSPLDRLTIGHYMMRGWSLEEDVRNLERLGFRSISLASTKLDAHGPEKAIALLRASTLRVAHVGSYGRFGTSRASRRAGMDLVRRA